jgi:hypothetical protein
VLYFVRCVKKKSALMRLASIDSGLGLVPDGIRKRVEDDKTHIDTNGRILCVRMVKRIIYDGAGSGQGVDWDSGSGAGTAG